MKAEQKHFLKNNLAKLFNYKQILLQLFLIILQLIYSNNYYNKSAKTNFIEGH